MEFNQENTGEKYNAIAETLGVDTKRMDQKSYRKAAIEAVRKLSEDVGIPTRLDKLDEVDFELLAKSAAADACAPGNPKEASVGQFREMLAKLK